MLDEQKDVDKGLKTRFNMKKYENKNYSTLINRNKNHRNNNNLLPF